MKDNWETIVHDRRVLYGMGGIVLGVLIVGGGYWFHRHRTEQYNQDAQVAFSYHLERMDLLSTNTSAQAGDWTALEESFGVEYSRYKDSSLGPYFRAFQSEAALRAGDREQAIALLAEAVRAMGSAAPLYYLYMVKLGVMQLDSHNEQHHESGMHDLLQLAQDTCNPYQGLAWYHLWHYAWVKGDSALIQRAYAKLQSFTDWYHMVQAKGAQITDTYE